MFLDRTEAGVQLAERLSRFKNQKVLILAIPRGGVEVGFVVAQKLNADFSILVSRKLPFPDNPESGFGAIAEDGSMFIFQESSLWLTKDRIRQIVEEQKSVIRDRIAVLRKNRKLPEIKDRIVILIDDGLAMGSTMMAAIRLCKNRNPEKIIVAVPVSGKSSADLIAQEVDELVVLEMPDKFRAVAEVYRNWYDLTDEDVLKILDKKNTFGGFKK
jgi:predicted phosphoribosyltransferase